MSGLLDRLRMAKVARVENPSPVELASLAADIEFRAGRVEVHAKELWEIRTQLNVHLAASAPGSDVERRLVETMRHLPSVAQAITLGEEARRLREVAQQLAAHAHLVPVPEAAGAELVEAAT